MNSREEFCVKRSEKKSIYIVLSQTGTGPSRLIRFCTNEPYAHASLSFEKDLSEMYSFARRGVWNPFNAGFVSEDIESGIFGRYKSTTCSIYELKVEDDQYRKLREQIEIFINNRNDYSYNFLGVVGAYLNVPIQRKQRYFCSQFVAYILERSGIHIFNKNCALVQPVDIRLNENLKPIYKGKLTLYKRVSPYVFD